MINFIVEINPISRVSRDIKINRGKVCMITPPDVSAYQEELKYKLKRYAPSKPTQRPVSIKAIFYLPRPKSVKKRILPHKKPDLSNIYKNFEDCLQGLFFVNDSQVVDIDMKKRYAACTPCVAVRIEEFI